MWEIHKAFKQKKVLIGSPKTSLYLWKSSFRYKHSEVTYFMKTETETRCCQKLPSGFFSLLSLSVSFLVP